MEKQIENLFIPLHNLAINQDENFLTEIFAFLLRYLIENEQDAAIKLLKHLSHNMLIMSPNELSGINIRTQTVTSGGIPDIEIKTNNILIFIEAKIDSDFGNKQLERYKNFLNSYTLQTSLKTALITLTRYQYKLHNADIDPDYGFRWHDLSDWLNDLSITKDISRFLVEQFLGLLKHRGIAMETISWQLIDGLKSLKNLTVMIGEALSATSTPIHSRSGAWNWIGYYLENKKFFVGIYFDTPHLVVLNTEEVSLRNDCPEEPEIGRYQGTGWRNEIDLSSENIHFFSRSKASQIACLEEFIKNSIEYGKNLIKT